MRASPYYTTYATHRYPFVGSPDLRDSTSTSRLWKDQVFSNVFPSAHKGTDGQDHYYLEMRPALWHNDSYHPAAVTTGQGRGIYYWETNSRLYYVVGNSLYEWLGVGTPPSVIQTLAGAGGTVKFYEFANDVNQYFLILLDGTNGYVINNVGSVTKITSANFPTPHQVNAAVLDGYLFVAKVGTADIYNCKLNDPLTWTAGDFITAEAFSDPIKALVRQGNYVVGIGSRTIEFFYDAGTSPGTPLARNAAALRQIGTPAPDSVVEVEDQIIFIGQTQTGGKTIWLFDGFSPTEIGIEAVRRDLDTSVNVDEITAFCVRTKGHKFYALKFLGGYNTTWVYDFDTKMWHKWEGSSGYNFPCTSACDYGRGFPFLLDKLTGLVYQFDDTRTQDSTGDDGHSTMPISCTVVTSRLDYGTMNRKFMHRFTLISDTPTTITGNTFFSLSWSDDDYATWNGTHTIPMGTMPTLTRLGSFRRRAFRLFFTSDSPVRLEGFEVDINTGSQ